MTTITIHRFEFKDYVDGQNPFDAICKDCGLKPEAIRNLTFHGAEVSFEEEDY